MRKLVGAGLAAVISLFAIMLVAPSASAYPAPGVTIHVNDKGVVSGKVIVINAHAQTSCDWSATLFGVTRTGHGKHFHAKWEAPTVQHKTTYTLDVTCSTGSSNARFAGHAGDALIPSDQVVTRTIQITVFPAGANAAGAVSQGGGALPNTGGPNAALLGGAAALILVGAGTVLFTRRRSHAHA